MIASRVGTALALAVTTAASGQDPADIAWRLGNHAEAESLYARVLARDSSDSRALHRLSLMHAWKERYPLALSLIDHLIALYPDNVDARIDRARITAWRGDLNNAMAQLQLIIDTHPANLRALHAQAQFAGWAGETDRALATYDQLMEITPEDPSLRKNQALVLTWAARHREASAIYDSLLALNPDDEEILLAVGRLLSWSGRLDSAAAIYRRVLDRNPTHVGAMEGEARTITWSGDLVEGEARWRRTIEVDPSSVTALVGLAQTLRWQGRPGPALQVLQHALTLSPNDRDVLTQLRWTESVIQPRASTVITQESDSDGNRVQTTVVRAAWRPRPAVQVGLDVYRRRAGVTTRPGDAPTSVGATISMRAHVEPGWALNAGVGVSSLATAQRDAVASFQAGVSSPNRNPIAGTVSLSRAAFDYTQTLIENGVTMMALDVSARARINSVVSAGLSVGYASFRGSIGNRRLNAGGNVTKRVHPQWTVGAFVRVLGFQEDVADGYFDPSYFGIGELLTRWNRTRGRFSLQLDLAPGFQQVRSATPRPTFRTAGRIGYTIAPGRDLTLQGAYSSAGLQNIVTTTSDYRYYAVSFAASWLF